MGQRPLPPPRPGQEQYGNFHVDVKSDPRVYKTGQPTAIVAIVLCLAALLMAAAFSKAFCDSQREKAVPVVEKAGKTAPTAIAPTQGADFSTGLYALDLETRPASTPTATSSPALAQTIDEAWRTPSSSELTGGATRFGDWRHLLDTLRWHAGAIKVDVENGVVDRDDLSDRESYLLALAELEYDDFEQLVARKYDGLVALRSPSDIGREYTLSSWYSEVDRGYLPFDEREHVVGCVLVGDTAARNDYYHIGNSVHGDYRLVDWRFYVYDVAYSWVADLDNYLYYRSGGDGGLVLVGLSEGCR